MDKRVSLVVGQGLRLIFTFFERCEVRCDVVKVRCCGWLGGLRW